MKFGILTFHNIPNTGACLQAYALCKKMRDLGADCEIIDYECENIVKRELQFKPGKNFLKTIYRKLLVWPKEQKKIAGHQEFMLQHHMYSSRKYNRTTISEANKVYDAFISGSDMIWNQRVSGNDSTYLLDFAKDKYRFSYGTSIGANDITEDLKVIQPFLRNYEKISVRESDTKDVLETEYGIKSCYVVDPTMLIHSDEWAKFSVPLCETDYVLVYFDSQEIYAAASRYATEHHKKLIVLGIGSFLSNKKHKDYYRPEEFISYIKNASAVFTNSYHGLLFALYFHKPVWTAKQDDRQQSLLNSLDLEKCFVWNDKNFVNRIDYDRCDKIMTTMRDNSINYLKEIVNYG